MFGPRVWVGLLLIGMFAGCVGSDETKGGPAESSTPSATIDVQKGTGAIQGSLMDLESRPVSGAQVLVRQAVHSNATEVELSSDEAGSFLVEGLELGEYDVYVSKLGFMPVDPRRVDVIEGDPFLVDFQMEEIGVPEAHHRTDVYQTNTLAMVCPVIQNSGNFWCTGLYYTTNVSWPVPNDETKNGELQSVIVESQWEPSQSVCTMGAGHWIYGPEWASSFAPNFWFTPPNREGWNRIFIPRDGAEDIAMHSAARTEQNGGTQIPTNGDWAVVTMWYALSPLGLPVDLDCLVDLKYDVAVTTFWVEPGPADYSYFAGV